MSELREVRRASVPERLAGARPVHPEAYDTYLLRGRASFSRRVTPDNEAAITALERAARVLLAVFLQSRTRRNG